jgi:penicillin-binding protein, 1A family
LKVFRALLLTLIVLALLGAAVAGGGYYWARAHFGPELPSVSTLRNIQLGAPLRIYTRDGKLLGQFGAERREILSYDQFPPMLVKSFLAAEDADFFEHGAVDWPGLMRAAFVLVTTGQKRQGGSTIAMQLARDLFLTPQKTYTRKIKEILLAQRMEKELSKKDILTLYLNRVFLGNRAYGVGAAAQVYYGKDIDQLTLSEMATLAGLPKAPSRDNPIYSAKNAGIRRNYVLGRLRDLGWITDAQYREAMSEPVQAHLHAPDVDVTAGYVAEMVRAQMVQRYGEAAYTAGYSVVTTIDAKDQNAAVAAVRKGLLDYEHRHGYDGPEGRLPADLVAQLRTDPQSQAVQDALDSYDPVGGLRPAVVLRFDGRGLRVLTTGGQTITLPPSAYAWAKLKPDALKVGDIVRLGDSQKHPQLEAVPKVQGALVSVDPDNGAIRALVGGFDSYANNYNRVSQAHRQVGSGFKPFYYAAALTKGYTPASMFLDEPIVVNADPSLGNLWRPQDDTHTFLGPMRMREALAQSRNLASIRILQAVGLDYALPFISKTFGIPQDVIPNNLTAALGTAALTPLAMARAYSVFANGGYLIDPYFIRQITGPGNTTLFQAQPATACPSCDDGATPPSGQLTAPRTLDAVDDYLMWDMLHDVAVHGTGSATQALGRDDLAGKTGTTNNHEDAWFNGFGPNLVAIAWVGFDQPKNLGYGEYGSKAALPIWMDYMKTALAGVPQSPPKVPNGVTQVQIDPSNGKQVGPNFPNPLSEYVQSDHLPPMEDQSSPHARNPAEDLY